MAQTFCFIHRVSCKYNGTISKFEPLIQSIPKESPSYWINSRRRFIKKLQIRSSNEGQSDAELPFVAAAQFSGFYIHIAGQLHDLQKVLNSILEVFSAEPFH